MSGSASTELKAEPNLTPMLDMVFQLITFFMIVMTFKAAELDLAVTLPAVGSAPSREGPDERKFDGVEHRWNEKGDDKNPENPRGYVTALKQKISEDKIDSTSRRRRGIKLRSMGWTIEAIHPTTDAEPKELPTIIVIRADAKGAFQPRQ